MHDDIEIIRMPKLGMSMTEGKVNEWYYKEGDTIESGEELAEVSTEKISHGISSSEDGTLQKILVAVEETVAIETPLAIIATGNISDEALQTIIQSLKE